MRPNRPKRFSLSFTGPFISANDSSIPAANSVSSSSTSMSAAVTSTLVTGSAATTTQRSGLGAASTASSTLSWNHRRWRRTAARPSGTAAGREPCPRRGMTRHVVIALDAAFAAEDGIVRPPRGPQELDREREQDGWPIPATAPSMTTPAAQPIESQASQGWMRWMRRRSAISNRPSADASRPPPARPSEGTAAGGARGRRSATTAPAPTTPRELRARPGGLGQPGVRDELLLIGIPEQSRRQVGRAEAHHLLVLIARLPVGVRAAHPARDSTLVSANETRATAAPPTSTGTTSSRPIPGTAKAGAPALRQRAEPPRRRWRRGPARRPRPSPRRPRAGCRARADSA